MNGDAEHAVPLIEHLLQSKVSLLSPTILQLDPVWDTIKDDIRFRDMVKRLKLELYFPELKGNQ